MNPFHHGVSLEKEKILAPAATEYRAIVPHAREHPFRINLPFPGQEMQQALLAE